MNKARVLTAVAFFGLFCLYLPSARAVVMTYSAESIGSSDWRYHYTLTNDSLAVDIEEFTVYFDSALYANLAVDASPADWDSLVAQPDSGIPADGFFDSLALVQGIAPGDSLGGFSVSFTYLGSGTPSAQSFEIVDADFNVIADGISTSASVPEPETLLLMLVGLGLIPFWRTRKGALA
jgi:hypothetical protein